MGDEGWDVESVNAVHVYLSPLNDMSDRMGAVSDLVKLRCGDTESGECHRHPSNLSMSKKHPIIRDTHGTRTK